MTTHSGHVLEELPEDARIFLQRGSNAVDVFYGVTVNYALTRMDDYDQPDCYLYCEDVETELLIKELLRASEIELAQFCILPVGPANMVQALGRLASEDRLPARAMAIIDADQENTQGCVSLPGEYAPEMQIITEIRQSALSEASERLDVDREGLSLALEGATALDDHHKWLDSLARELRYTKEYLWTTLCQVWVGCCLDPEVREEFVGRVREAIQP